MTDLEWYKATYGDILFPADVGTTEWAARREVQENPAGKWMCSYDGLRWQMLPMDTGKIDFQRVLLRRIPNGVTVGVTADVANSPEKYMYSHDNGYTWRELGVRKSSAWIYHGRHDSVWFKKIN